MGTTTIFTRHNDLGLKFKYMSRKDLKNLNELSPFSEKKRFYRGWEAAYELHNGNVYVLVFWKGKLMKLEDAIKELDKKYWDKYHGKTLNLYEWTILKKIILKEVECLDKEFKKELKNKAIKTKRKGD